MGIRFCGDQVKKQLIVHVRKRSAPSTRRRNNAGTALYIAVVDKQYAKNKEVMDYKNESPFAAYWGAIRAALPW